jgi:formiminotetrahydrofolate cyclodeaminase
LQLENFSKDQILEEKLNAVGGIGGGESFFDAVASSSPAPGGGSVAAAVGALSAALAAMVARLTVNKKQYKDVKEELSDLRDKADDLRTELTELIKTDEEAFNKVMEAFKLPKASDEDVAARDQAIEEANKEAASVPLTVMGKALGALKLALVVSQKGNENSITDAGVAGLIGLAGVEGARYNVLINLQSIRDKTFVDKMKSDTDAVLADAQKIAGDIRKQVESKL